MWAEAVWANRRNRSWSCGDNRCPADGPTWPHRASTSSVTRSGMNCSQSVLTVVPRTLRGTEVHTAYQRTGDSTARDRAALFLQLVRVHLGGGFVRQPVENALHLAHPLGPLVGVEVETLVDQVGQF